MSDASVWLVLLLPLAGATIAGLFGPAYLKQHSHWPVIAGVAGAFAVALRGLLVINGHLEHPALTASANWFAAGDVRVSYGLSLDPLSAVMLMAITGIGTVISIYSIGYMAGDGGYPRYFAVFGLFVFSMCGLVLSDNLLFLYANWEGVGLCSYLLIGFWFNRPAAAAAARKAFLVTRIGDAGLILGIFLLWNACGHTLDYATLFERAKAVDTGTLTTALLLIFVGCVGKSAQFPLHVWLPDAMEGPTPASALIHAATMVTAGVYLVARLMPLFALAPTALLVVAIIGALTALIAALIALTQHDLKRVMAYSTVSQLGFMFLGLGAGREELAVFGATAAIFHLFTHAFFKALLFLASGSVMHAMGNVIDMRRFGGLRKVLPITHWTFAIGAAALAGLPPLSGFWSKDEILAAAQHSGHHYPIYMVLFWSATLTAFLTAFYTGRAYFRTFWGELVVPPEAGSHGHGDDHAHEDHGHAPAAHGDNHAHENHAHHGGPGVAHESPPVMTYPLIVLAIGAALVGLLLGPVTHWFPHFLERVPAYHEYLPHAEEHAMNTALLIQSALVAFAGLGLAWFFYVKNQSIPDAIGRSVPWLVEASRNRLYFDEIYNALLVLPATGFAHVASFFDGLIDGIVDLIARLPAVLARALRPIQNGLVQFYALAMILGTVMFIGILTLRGGR